MENKKDWLDALWARYCEMTEAANEVYRDCEVLLAIERASGREDYDISHLYIQVLGHAMEVMGHTKTGLRNISFLRAREENSGIPLDTAVNT